MPTPFFVFLRKTHTLPKVTSYDASVSDAARELQMLIDAGDRNQYRKRLVELRQQGKTFRLTDMKVYEIRDEGETIDVRIALQVKGYSITWYFWAPGGRDQYPQEARDEFYRAAAECHTQVKNSCDLYYRGSNAFHIKNMHHLETEDGHNHNHYRMKDNQPVTPQDLTEHLQAFKRHEICEKFFEEGEIEELCGKFRAFYVNWTYKEGDALSEKEEYFSQPSQQWNQADALEFELFGQQQEPCRINVDELRLDFEVARREIEEAIAKGAIDTTLDERVKRMEQEFRELVAYRQVGGSRGLGSERAMTRQVAGSHMPTIEAVVDKDDDIGVRPPLIPAWAVHARLAIAKARATIMAAHTIESDVQSAASAAISREATATFSLRSASSLTLFQPFDHRAEGITPSLEGMDVRLTT
ncbi:MAG: hypothetical protein A3E83_01750 [Gammaproteobacteria bacterium RIFCSPHIGHO2_12_FULL_41_20]|nr:MAG: hypothetical protein A3E83_01750 [Gammaproteobacteria bacterium RIFCSPHIGHO2_12_FULL_41_20]